MRSYTKIITRGFSISRSRWNSQPAQEQVARKYPLQVGGAQYQEGDRVIITSKDGRRVKTKLTSPLKSGSTTVIGVYAHEVKHSDIIGQAATRLYVEAASPSLKHHALRLRVAHPSLEQFVSLAPRNVTPIYSSYGATIVTLLDIHVPPPLPNNDPQTTKTFPFEILEAGTGNGGLTLHLARAIAAANPPPPVSETEHAEEDLEKSWSEWRSARRAVVHTVEFQEQRSRAAERLIKSFRGALYWPHIDFHSGDVGEWVKTEHERRRQTSGSPDGFLDVVILDLPAVHKQIQHVVETMKEDGQLVVWVPQITQVAACQQQIESLDLPMKLDQVVELGEGISNGRRWDMRFVKTRVEQRKEQEQSRSQAATDTVEEIADTDVDTAPALEEEKVSASVAEFPTMVCRPMVGELVMGGGFVGLWRKVTGSRPDKKSS